MIRFTTVPMFAAMMVAACWARAESAQPRLPVQFDVSPMVAFAETTTPEYTSAHPGEKTVRAQVVVSMFVPPTLEVTNVLYHLYFLEGPARIIDYGPRTRLITDVIGEIDVAKKTEQGNHISVNAGASFETWVSADAAVGRNESTATTTRYKMQPPVETVLAAGTSNRGRGVYFKLRQTTIETLEGEQRLELELRVPDYWRGGYMRLVAQASGENRVFTASSFLVPVYVQGDLDAQRVAQQLLTFEHYLLRAAQRHADQIHRAGRPTMVHEMALVPPKIPKEWQQSLLWRTTGESLPEFAARLPKPVRSAAANYHTSKRLALALGEPPLATTSAVPLEVAKPDAKDETHSSAAETTPWKPRTLSQRSS